MLLAQVPTTAVVNRAAAETTVKVAYAGPPQFVTIPSTSMYYAVNTPDKVIRVGSLYYLCFQGIWFVSTNQTDPGKRRIPCLRSSTPFHQLHLCIT